MNKVSFWLSYRNNGDGSVSAFFFSEESDAKLFLDNVEKRFGIQLCDTGPHKITLKFSKEGKLLNPCFKKDFLLAEKDYLEEKDQ